MPEITAPPPKEVSADLARLRSALDEEVPAKALDRNLLIATWTGQTIQYSVTVALS